jgi:UDP-glucose 4-epimerase
MILITGGLGMIGMHTARSLLDLGEEVVLTQYREARRPDFLAAEIGKRAFVEPLDMMDGEALMSLRRRYKFTGIAHLAAPALGALSAADDFKLNTYGLLNVLQAAESWGVRRLTLASSIAVYAGVKQGPFREDEPLRMHGGGHVEVYKKMFEILGSHYGQRRPGRRHAAHRRHLRPHGPQPVQRRDAISPPGPRPRGAQLARRALRRRRERPLLRS